MEPNLDSLKDIRKVLAQQRRAFDAHLAPERERLWAFCRQLTGSLWEGEDLVQETMMRAFGGLTTAWTPTAPRAYLFRIATRLWIDRQRSALPDELPLMDEEVGITVEADLSEEGISAMEAMSVLPARQRVVLLLTQAFAFTAPEAAEVLEVSEGAVKAMLHRARQTLRSIPFEPTATTPDANVVQAFVDAFNRRDIDALTAMFHEDVRIDIIGAGEERGREQLKGSSIKYALEDEDASEAMLFTHLGEPMILLLKHLSNGGKAVSEVIRVQTVEGAVRRLRTYYFCPEALSEIAEAASMPVFSHGHYLAG